jgi:sulfite exporter TauE/SafE
MIGFLGSLHCIGMCGPIALALPLNRSSWLSQLGGTLIYNLGRILTYFSIGLIFGSLGKSVAFFGYQQQFAIGVGILIIALALLPYSVERLFDITPWLSKLLSRLKSSMRRFLQKRNLASLFVIGLLNGLLPCGLVYFAVIGAITSFNTWDGGLCMLVFGFGTWPMMFAAALSPGFIGIKWRNRVRKALPYFAVLIGLLFILRGMNLGVPYLSPKLLPESPEGVECHDPQ